MFASENQVNSSLLPSRPALVGLCTSSCERTLYTSLRLLAIFFFSTIICFLTFADDFIAPHNFVFCMPTSSYFNCMTLHFFPVCIAPCSVTFVSAHSVHSCSSLRISAYFTYGFANLRCSVASIMDVANAWLIYRVASVTHCTYCWTNLKNCFEEGMSCGG